MQRLDRGDTIIEVLLAITIFSMVAVGVITVMNQGTSSAQRALETTLVRQQIDAQAEALRAVHQALTADSDTAAAEWSEMIAKADSVSYAPDDSCPTQSADIPGAFAMNTTDASILTGSWFGSIASSASPVYAQFVPAEAKTYGLWIEVSKVDASDNVPPAAYNFRVRACWFGSGRSVNAPMRLETLVRLYEP